MDHFLTDADVDGTMPDVLTSTAGSDSVRLLPYLYLLAGSPEHLHRLRPAVLQRYQNEIAVL
jgi:hypothetical protein